MGVAILQLIIILPNDFDHDPLPSLKITGRFDKVICLLFQLSHPVKWTHVTPRTMTFLLFEFELRKDTHTNFGIILTWNIGN